jgi:hypothetical protein
MNVARLSLLALSMLAGVHAAFAKAPVAAPVTATPVGSPGDWIGSGDYPATALRFDMTGITAFRLVVDPAGKPSRCDIVESSGFDTLDAATCQRLLANAHFSPARDRAGKPIEGTYSSRVRWAMPREAQLPVTERFASLLLSIDQAGNVTSCRTVIHLPTEAKTSDGNLCERASKSMPQALGREFRGNFHGASADVEVRLADAFTPALRARVLSPVPGYEQRGLNIYRFTVASDRTIGQCRYEEQRGSDLLAADFCLAATREIFDPPFSAFDKDGVASGWHIMRVLLKTSH